MSNLGGGAFVSITNETAFDDLAPTWSRDGTKIIFQSDRSGTMQIWSMNADGSNKVQLTSNAAAPAASPSWWN
jgi:TolB protein